MATLLAGPVHACRSVMGSNPFQVWCLAVTGPVPLFACRASLTLSDFELVRRLGDGSYSQVIMARLK